MCICSAHLWDRIWDPTTPLLSKVNRGADNHMSSRATKPEFQPLGTTKALACYLSLIIWYVTVTVEQRTNTSIYFRTYVQWRNTQRHIPHQIRKTQTADQSIWYMYKFFLSVVNVDLSDHYVDLSEKYQHYYM